MFAAMQISFWYFRRSRLIVFGACPRERVCVYNVFADKKVASIFFSSGGWWVPRGKQLATPTISAVAADTPSISFHPSSVAMVRRARGTI